MVRHIHNITSRVHIASQAIRTTPAYKLDNQATSIPTEVLHRLPPQYSNHEHYTFQFKVTQDMFNQYLRDAPPAIMGFSKLLQRCQFITLQHHPGFAWYEWFLLAAACSMTLCHLSRAALLEQPNILLSFFGSLRSRPQSSSNSTSTTHR